MGRPAPTRRPAHEANPAGGFPRLSERQGEHPTNNPTRPSPGPHGGRTPYAASAAPPAGFAPVAPWTEAQPRPAHPSTTPLVSPTPERHERREPRSADVASQNGTYLPATSNGHQPLPITLAAPAVPARSNGASNGTSNGASDTETRGWVPRRERADRQERTDRPPLRPGVRGDVGPLIEALHELFERDRATASQGNATRCGICYLHFSRADLVYREAEGFYVCPNCAQSLGPTTLMMVRRQQE